MLSQSETQNEIQWEILPPDDVEVRCEPVKDSVTYKEDGSQVEKKIMKNIKSMIMSKLVELKKVKANMEVASYSYSHSDDNEWMIFSYTIDPDNESRWHPVGVCILLYTPLFPLNVENYKIVYYAEPPESYYYLWFHQNSENFIVDLTVVEATTIGGVNARTVLLSPRNRKIICDTLIKCFPSFIIHKTIV